MSGHTFLYSSSVRKICDIINAGDIGDIRYINSRRLNLGLFQKDINVVWDLAPHDISIILHILGELPLTVNCQGMRTSRRVSRMSQTSRFLFATRNSQPSKAVGSSPAKSGK